MTSEPSPESVTPSPERLERLLKSARARLEMLETEAEEQRALIAIMEAQQGRERRETR